MFGMGNDGAFYWLKSQKRNPLTPASEYFCSSLARRCGIPVPNFCFALCDDEIVFASRELPLLVNRPLFRTSVANGNLAVNGFRWVYSATLALDLFVGNDDRHMQNYAFCDTNRPEDKYEVYAFDFGNGWWRAGLPNRAIDLQIGCNTLEIAKRLSLVHGFDDGAGLHVLEILRTTSRVSIEAILADIPDGLLSAEYKSTTLDWWATEKDNRIDKIKAGIENGVYVPVRNSKLSA